VTKLQITIDRGPAVYHYACGACPKRLPGKLRSGVWCEQFNLRLATVDGRPFRCPECIEAEVKHGQ
jgi:hypothetical protein